MVNFVYICCTLRYELILSSFCSRLSVSENQNLAYAQKRDCVPLIVRGRPGPPFWASCTIFEILTLDTHSRNRVTSGISIFAIYQHKIPSQNARVSKTRRGLLHPVQNCIAKYELKKKNKEDQNRFTSFPKTYFYRNRIKFFDNLGHV